MKSFSNNVVSQTELEQKISEMSTAQDKLIKRQKWQIILASGLFNLAAVVALAFFL